MQHIMACLNDESFLVSTKYPSCNAIKIKRLENLDIDYHDVQILTQIVPHTSHASISSV